MLMNLLPLDITALQPCLQLQTPGKSRGSSIYTHINKTQNSSSQRSSEGAHAPHTEQTFLVVGAFLFLFSSLETNSLHLRMKNRILHPNISPGSYSQVCTPEIYVKNVKHMVFDMMFD